MDYKFARLQDRCAGCDKEIAEGDVCFSLVNLEPEEPIRRDYCTACFTHQDHGDAAYWRTRKRLPREPRRVVDFERLREIFVKMVTRPPERHQELAYLMGLLLVRRRLLKLKDFATEGDRDVLVLVNPRSGEVYRVEAPVLNPQRLLALRDDLSALVDGEIDWQPEGRWEEPGERGEGGSSDAAGESGRSGHQSATRGGGSESKGETRRETLEEAPVREEPPADTPPAGDRPAPMGD